MRTTALPRLRRHLHFDALIRLTRRAFDKLPEPRRCPSFTLADTLMAGLALFSLKDPSLLAFPHRALDHNLCSVFGLQAIDLASRRSPACLPAYESLPRTGP
jgi:hypothetical protein